MEEYGQYSRSAKQQMIDDHCDSFFGLTDQSGTRAATTVAGKRARISRPLPKRVNLTDARTTTQQPAQTRKRETRVRGVKRTYFSFDIVVLGL